MKKMECTSGRGKRKLWLGEDGWGKMGGYMNARIGKLEDQFAKQREKNNAECAVESNIFRGVAVFVNGYTRPSAAEIKMVMARHGGSYVHYYSRSKVTHTIASNLPCSKIRALKPGQLVVRPEWITDSIAAGKLLPTLSYEQYSNNRGQINIEFSAKTDEDASNLPNGSIDCFHDEKLQSKALLRETNSVENADDIENAKRGIEQSDRESETEKRVSAFRPLIPNARLTPVKRALTPVTASRTPNISPASKLDRRLNDNVLSPVSAADFQLTPTANRNFDLKTPHLFLPGQASTPFISKCELKSFQEVVDSEVEAWLNESEEENSQTVRTPLVSRVVSRNSNASSKRSLVSSRQSKYSVDLFESEEDTEHKELNSDKGSRKQLKRRLELTSQPSCSKRSKEEVSVDITEVPEELNMETETDELNLHISDSGSEISMPSLELEYEAVSTSKPTDVSMKKAKDEKRNFDAVESESAVISHSDKCVDANGESDSQMSETNRISNDKTQNIEKNSQEKITDKDTAKISPQKRSLRAGDTNFVAEFYSNSRLHHLSAWGAECRDYVNLLQSEGDTSFPGRQRLIEHLQELRRSESEESSRNASSQSEETSRSNDQSERVVMHIDMDCFFVSVGLRNRPELKGKPVAVTHSKGGGEVKFREGRDPETERDLWMKRKLGRSKLKLNAASKSATAASENGKEGDVPHRVDVGLSMADIASCSYEARKAGVKNGMLLGQAMQICPDLLTIPYDFNDYSRVSRLLYNSVASFTHHIEAVSCDELFVDCTEVLKAVQCTGKQFADFLRKEIEEKTKCTASAGLGSNILLARLATRAAKPNGSYHLPSEQVSDFIKKQNVKNLPGVGWSTLHRLGMLGVVTCHNLQQMSLGSLRQEFGQKTGSLLYRYCRGEDDREVKSEKFRKSVSAEINYGIRFSKDEEAFSFIRELAKEVQTRLEKVELLGKAITLKLKVRSEGAPKETLKFGGHGVCDSISKSAVVTIATSCCDVIARECEQLYKSLKLDPSDLRGMGIQMSKLGPAASAVDKRQKTLSFTTAPKRPEAATVMAPTSTPRRATSPVKTAASLSSERMSSCNGGTTSKVDYTPHQAAFDDLDDFLISPSQVDPDVLNELPVHLQRQIRAAMRRKRADNVRHTTCAGPTTLVNVADDARPGCSHWSSGNDVIVNDDADADMVKAVKDAILPRSMDQKKGNEAFQELPSFSQVDQDCLDALPSAIREEILGAYASRPKQVTTRTISPAKVVALSWKRGAERSPVKSPRKSPKKTPTKQKQSGRCVVKKTKRSPRKPGVSKAETAIVRSTPMIDQTERPIALCDAVSLQDVKELVGEWMTSSSSPKSTDIEQFLTYMTNLVDDHNLEQVFLLIRFIQRNLTKLPARDQWQEAAADFIERIQRCVTQRYGAPLKLTNS